MRTCPLAIALVAVLASACTEEPRIQLSSATVSSGFVRASHDAQGRPRFELDGATFRFIGGNMSELPWLDPSAQEVELQWAHDVGFRVIRVWGVDDSTNADEMAQQLRGLLDRAAAHDLHVTIALTHNYHQQNWIRHANTGVWTFHAVPGDARPDDFTGDGNGFYTRDCGSAAGLWCLADSWVDWGYTAYYRPYATRLVSLLADHPAVFSWDLANETSGSTRDPWIVGRVTSLYVDMAARIKAADPNHLVTTGLISSSWAGMEDPERDAVYGSPNVDYLTIHEYEHPLNDEAQDDEVWRANRRYQKPVVVEELGVRSTSSAQAYYGARFSPADPAFEATGIVYWGVASPASPGLTDGTWSPQALGEYDWFVSFWQSWSAQLAAEQQGAAQPPCVALAAGVTLGVNQSVASCDGTMTLAMQGDGNLVLYRNGAGPLWHACTQDASVTGAVMQGDGNLVLYASSGAIFDTHTWGHAGARLLFEGSGLVIRAPDQAVLWTSANLCR